MVTFLPESSPEALGIPSDAIEQFLQTAQKQHFGLHTFLLLRHGKCAAEVSFAPYSTNQVHILYSMSKSFTSTAVGFAIQEGLLSLTDPIISFFPELLSCPPCTYMQACTVRDLLCMGSGHTVEPEMSKEGGWVQHFLESYVPKKPGTFFLYNTTGTYVLSAIVQKVTGQTVSEYLKTRLFEPLGFSEETCFAQSPDNIDCGGFGLNITARDLAKFGQFLLQRGKWNSKQLLNAEWIDMASAKQIDNSNHGKLDWGSGYGFQFWRCQPDGVYRGDGAFGQYCIVMPKQDAVLVMNASTGADMQKTLTVVWELLLSAMQDEPLVSTSNSAYRKAYCVSTELDGKPSTSPVDGKKYRLSPNRYGFTAMTLRFGEQADVLSFEGESAPVIITAYHHSFSEAILPIEKSDPVAAIWGKTGEQMKALYSKIFAAGGWHQGNYRLYLFGRHTTQLDFFEIHFSKDGQTAELKIQQTGTFSGGKETVFAIS